MFSYSVTLFIWIVGVELSSLPHMPLIVKAGLDEPPISNAPFNLSSLTGLWDKTYDGPLTEYHVLFASK